MRLLILAAALGLTACAEAHPDNETHSTAELTVEQRLERLEQQPVSAPCPSEEL
jgi:hypothetical protein